MPKEVKLDKGNGEVIEDVIKDIDHIVKFLGKVDRSRERAVAITNLQQAKMWLREDIMVNDQELKFEGEPEKVPTPEPEQQEQQGA